jgi:RNA polymerase sigma-70 factor (sigma-E family)
MSLPTTVQPNAHWSRTVSNPPDHDLSLEGNALAPVRLEGGSGVVSNGSGQQAFDQLYREYWPSLSQLATLMTGNAADAQDLAQEAFIKWYARRGSVQNDEAYLRTVLVNLVKANGRRSSVRKRFAYLWEQDAVESTVAPSGDHLADIVATLPDRQRAAVVLRYYEGRSENEIAEILQCRPGTVKSLLSRALHDLQRLVEK